MTEAAFTEAVREFDEGQARMQLQERFLAGLDPIVSAVGTVRVGSSQDDAEAEEGVVSAPRFPVGVLPEPLQAFINEAADSLPVPIDLVAAPVLACLGSAIGAHRLIQPKANWTTSAALYVACIADPGSLKSAALKVAAAPVFRQQDQ